MLELIERLEKATEPALELDGLIAEAIEPNRFKELDRRKDPNWDYFCAIFAIPRYTASIDAALTLVPHGCDWEFGSAKLVANGCWHWAKVIAIHAEHVGKGPTTPALVLCIAALKARFTQCTGRENNDHTSSHQVRRATADASILPSLRLAKGWD